LLWTFARAIERCQLVREHRLLVQNEQQRLSHEHQEAERLLGEQRALIAELEKIRVGNSLNGLAEGEAIAGRELSHGTVSDQHNADQGADPSGSVPVNAKSHACDLPERLVTHYREMLRAYVVMGAGNLAEEMVRLAAMLTEADVSAQRTMQLHVQVLEELVGSLGNRSARHVMTRADLLVLEIMAHLADGYRRRYHEDCQSSTQLGLPGF
jgi:hypothetical protein